MNYSFHLRFPKFYCQHRQVSAVGFMAYWFDNWNKLDFFIVVGAANLFVFTADTLLRARA